MTGNQGVHKQAKSRAELLIKGRVQGVFFRCFTRRRACSVGVNGYVRNLPDGRVEAIFEGNERAVKDMVNWCYQGPPSARVDSVDIEWMDSTGEFSGFNIRY